MKNLQYAKRKPENTIFFELSGFLQYYFINSSEHRKT